MKKLIALLLAMLMLFAATAVAEETDLSAYDILDFTIAMDAVPEGYTYTEEIVGDIHVCSFEPNDDQLPCYHVSIVYDELANGATMPEEITEEQKAMILEAFSEDYNEPVLTMTKTSHGTPVLVIDEANCESDYGEIYTVYEGYAITVSITSPNAITEAEYATALQILSDLWIVK